MSARLPRVLRRREAERRRVDSFVAAIRRSADCTDACEHPGTRPLPPVGVERVETPWGPAWQIDEPSRARLAQHRNDETVALPLSLVRLMVQP